MEKTNCKKIGHKEFLTEEQLREHLQYFCGREVYVFLKEGKISFSASGKLLYSGKGKYAVEIPGRVQYAVEFLVESVAEVNGQEIKLTFIKE